MDRSSGEHTIARFMCGEAMHGRVRGRSFANPKNEFVANLPQPASHAREVVTCGCGRSYRTLVRSHAWRGHLGRVYLAKTSTPCQGVLLSRWSLMGGVRVTR